MIKFRNLTPSRSITLASLIVTSGSRHQCRPRHPFVDPILIAYAYTDQPLVPGSGPTIESPFVVAAAAEVLAANPAERVEGYTNFLWTVLMSMPIHFGFDPKAFSFLLGLISFALSLVFSYKLALLLTNSRNTALLVVLFLGSNYTFSSFATGGLETPMQTCLFVICMYLAVNFVQVGTTPRKLLVLSLVGSAALLLGPQPAVPPVRAFDLPTAIAPGRRVAPVAPPLLLILRRLDRAEPLRSLNVSRRELRPRGRRSGAADHR